MARYLTLLSFLFVIFLGSLYARYLNRREFSNTFMRSHHVGCRSVPCLDGMCLSQYDYCGTGDEYCSDGCKGGSCYGGSSGGGDNPPPPSDTDLGACGIQSSGDELVCAMAALDFDPQTPDGNPNNNPLCGLYISVTGPNGIMNVKVVDRCPECKSGDLDLSPAAFNQIGDSNAGRVHINWHYV